MIKLTGSNKIKTAIFISGTGSNFKNLIKFSLLKKSPIVVEFGGTDEFDGGAQFFIHYKADSGNLQKLEKFLNTWIKKEKTADVMLDGYQSVDDFSDKGSGWWTYAIDVYPNE